MLLFMVMMMKNAFLIDTRQQGGQVQTSLKSLAMARSEKGPMASKNLYYTLRNTDRKFDLKKVIITAIKNNASEYLNPPITNISYKGILKQVLKLSNGSIQVKILKENLSKRLY